MTLRNKPIRQTQKWKVWKRLRSAYVKANLDVHWYMQRGKGIPQEKWDRLEQTRKALDAFVIAQVFLRELLPPEPIPERKEK